jgi:hypothetical protein
MATDQEIPSVKYGASTSTFSEPFTTPQAVTPITGQTATVAPADVPDKGDVPHNDPNAIPGKTYDPYQFKYQGYLYRLWHICVNAWGLGVYAPTLAEIPAPETRPYWAVDHALAFRIASILGYVYSLIAIWDGTAQIAYATAPAIDPEIGYTKDPWNAPEYLEDMPIAQTFQSKTGVEMVCHTRRQLEVVKLAMAYGVRAKSIKDIPLPPPLLSDNGHYWIGASELAWEATHSSFLKNAWSKLLGGFKYLFIGADGKLDLKNVTWMIALILGTAQASGGDVTKILTLLSGAGS